LQGLQGLIAVRIATLGRQGVLAPGSLANRLQDVAAEGRRFESPTTRKMILGLLGV